MDNYLHVKGFSGKIAYGYLKDLNSGGRNVWVTRNTIGTIQKCDPANQNLNGAAATARFLNTGIWR